MFNLFKDCLTTQIRILQRLEDLEDNQRINDKLIMLLYKRLKLKKTKPNKMEKKRAKRS